MPGDASAEEKPERSEPEGDWGDADWRKIAEQASREKDPITLINLVEELCKILDRNHQKRSRNQDTNS